MTLGGGGHGRGPWHVRPPIRRPGCGVLPRRMRGFDGTSGNAPRRPRAARPRRARLLHGDLSRGRVGRARHPDRVRPGQPLALAARHAARDPLPDPSRAGEARALRPRPRVRRRGRPAAGLADLRRVGGRRARRRRGPPVVDPRRLRPRLLRPLRRGRLRLQVHGLLRRRDRGGDPLRRSGRRHRVAGRRRAPLLRARPHRPAAVRDRGRAALRVRVRDGRFAPSPTGTLHVGNLRTALLAWLFARSQGARFLVRMEDLDPGRVRSESATEQLEDLRAIGLDWDGEVLFQSARQEAYDAAIERLRADGRVYECFCTRAEIRAAASAPHGPLPEGAYPGTCLRLTDGERRRKRAGGRPPALRLRAGAARIGFEDRLLGRHESVVDDFVVRRNDGAAAYNLAVMVDDAAQGIGEVVRGADLLDSTPRQLLVARLLGLPEPSWAHVPLVLGPDGARLAKRHGAVTLRDLEPAASVRWMASTLGFEGATTAAEMLERFDPARLPGEPTRFAGI